MPTRVHSWHNQLTIWTVYCEPWEVIWNLLLLHLLLVSQLLQIVHMLHLMLQLLLSLLLTQPKTYQLLSQASILRRLC